MQLPYPKYKKPKKKVKAKRKKLRKFSALKREAWDAFSIWVRQRGMNADGQNACITCGKLDHWKNLHAGHFYHGRNSQSAMDERNVFAQCCGCNTYRGGNLIEYSEFLRKKYGPEIIEVLRELKTKIWTPSRDELIQIMLKYRNLRDQKVMA